MSECKFRVKGNTFLKLRPSLCHGVSAPTAKRNRTCRLVVVRPDIKVFWALSVYISNFSAGQLGFKFRNNPARNVFLQIDGFISAAIKATASQDVSRCCINQLCRDPKVGVSETHATFDHEANLES